MLREVNLPGDVSGRLFLYSMPGRTDHGHSIEEDSDLIAQQGIDYVICLAPLDEIREKSPEYANAIEAGEVKWKRKEFPIKDFSVPQDREQQAFVSLVEQMADDLRAGKLILIHCAGGIGRTGMVAACVILALGLKKQEALDAVRKAGSEPETPDQRKFIEWVAQTVHQ